MRKILRRIARMRNSTARQSWSTRSGSGSCRQKTERHRGEASDAHRRFSWLGEGDQEALLTFPRSL